MNQLPEHLQEDELKDDLQREAEQGIVRRIESADEAARYAYALSETNKEIEELDRTAEAERDRWQKKIEAVDKWHAGETKPLKDKLSYLRQMLINYHVEQFHNAPNDKARNKLKSINLPYGVKLKSSQPQVGYEIKDEAAYKDFMAANGLVEEQEPKVKWGELKKTLKVTDDGRVVTDSGELLEFLTATQPERKFEVN